MCTATLVAPRWVLTAAHCIDYYYSGLVSFPSYFYFGDVNNPDTGRVVSDSSYTTQLLINFGPQGQVYPTNCPLAYDCINNFNEALDYSGTSDIALALLSKPVPRNAVYSPAAIASVPPPDGYTMSSYGFGATESGSNDSPPYKYMTNWTFHTPSTPRNQPTGNYLPWLNNMGVVQNEWPTGALDPYYNLVTKTSGLGGALASGDSGGPAFDEAGNIWGVSSAVSSLDYFGSVAYFHDWICSQSLAQEPHTWKTTGEPLIVPVFGCTDALASGQVIPHVCIDAVLTNSGLQKCCDPKGTWDTDCVAEATKYPTGGWNQGFVAGTQQRYPMDFNVVAFQGASDIQDISGPLAAGGSINLSGFSLNTMFTAGYPVGLIGGGDVSLSSGFVGGGIDVVAGKNVSVPATVTEKRRAGPLEQFAD